MPKICLKLLDEYDGWQMVGKLLERDDRRRGNELVG